MFVAIIFALEDNNVNNFAGYYISKIFELRLKFILNINRMVKKWRTKIP